MAREAISRDGPFDIGYGFTDQIFMVDRYRLAQPIYRHISPASWWYPTSHVAPIFEQRIDAWMRSERLTRATYRDVRYVHDETMATHPAQGLANRVERKVRQQVFSALQRLPKSAPPTLRRW
jgi:hypothetical protein